MKVAKTIKSVRTLVGAARDACRTIGFVPTMGALQEGHISLIERCGKNGDHLKAGRIIVSDYLFEKELIYAERLLNKEQLALYRKLYSRVSSSVTRPVLVIYLREPPEMCLKRIHTRNRPYEQKIEPKFLKALDRDYERLFAGWKGCPVIRLSEFDCLSEKNVKHLANQIVYYTALGARR